VSKKVDSKYVDLLDEDKPIAEQKFVCLSFISPEGIIKDKQRFFFEEYVKQYEFAKSMEKFTQFINYISYKYEIKSDELHEQFKTFVDSEKENGVTHSTHAHSKKYFFFFHTRKKRERPGAVKRRRKNASG
jgi:hypothetical protein